MEPLLVNSKLTCFHQLEAVRKKAAQVAAVPWGKSEGPEFAGSSRRGRLGGDRTNLRCARRMPFWGDSL